MHDREYIDAGEGVRDPFKRVIRILNETHDQAIVAKYGIWVVRHDPAAGLKVRAIWYIFLYLTNASSMHYLQIFISRAALKLDDAAVLSDMQSANPVAASQFLEHVVFSKRSMVCVFSSGFTHMLISQIRTLRYTIN